MIRVLSGLLLLVSQGDSDWFESLKQPRTGASCCSIADCYKTDSELRDGVWWAEVRGYGWLPMPASSVLKQNSVFDKSVVCSSPGGAIYCFVPYNPTY